MRDARPNKATRPASAKSKQARGVGGTGEPALLPPAPEPLGTPGPDRDRGIIGRNILLFSDGTGNSSAKVFKTNVWRMYEACDLGPSDKGQVQIAYYDNGVGTQQIRALAMLTGIFGIGLKNNVMRLYRFACRNGNANSRFYCFGFSRGAYTIRLVTAMIAKYGLVCYSNEGELEARVRDTFRQFSSDNNPNVAGFVGTVGRRVRDVAIKVKRAIVGPRLKDEASYIPAKVEFIGAWDTVAAYGGPIAEITRGIDDYIWPLTMPDSCLNTNVARARHALAIDDERDAFQPVLWDEVDWDAKAKRTHPDDAAQQQEFRDRLKQVWFAGMHADVGGGYPDESLSYVSLLWMMHEAQAAGLVLLDDAVKRYRDQANSLGPIHNSRGGLGAYYRPQPRKIAAFLHPDSGMDLEAATLSLRDPVLGELPKPPHGLLLGCRVHESVVARLYEGTDDYAPAILPPLITIEPFSANARRGSTVAAGVQPTIVPAELLYRLSKRADDWYTRQERIWDFVFWRRIAYFGAAIATFLLATLPLWANVFPYPATADGRSVLVRLSSWNDYLPVDLVRPWIAAFQINWALFFGLLTLSGALTYAGVALQGMAHSRSYTLWRERITGKAYSFPLPGPFARFRTSRAYQRLLQSIKWRALPALAALLLVGVTGWLGLAGITQIFWAFREPGLCPREPLTLFASSGEQFVFSPQEVCVRTGIRVQRAHRYEVAFREIRPWKDDQVRVTPAGLPASGMSWVQTLGVPYRRIVDGRYLQPVIEVRPPNTAKDYVPRTQVRLLSALWDGERGEYVATFTANQSGELYMFANDAAFLGGISPFYQNNHGRSRVTVRDLDPSGPIAPLDDSPAPND